MREIKFRGYNKENGWIYGYYYKLSTRNVGCITYDSQKTGDWEHELVDVETIGQYTGLKDKNGKEIYDGDVLDNKEKVYFSDGCFMTSIGALALSCNHREVIGNIYENPELL